MLRSTELNTFSMTYITYRVVPLKTAYRLNRATPQLLRWLSMYVRCDGNPLVLVVGTSLKTLNVHIINCKTL